MAGLIERKRLSMGQIDQIQNRQSFKADRLLKRKADPLPGAFRNGQIRDILSVEQRSEERRVG